jgi:hypothetical protein
MIPRSIHNNHFISPVIYKYIINNTQNFKETTVNIYKHTITIYSDSIDLLDIENAEKIFNQVSKPTNDSIHTYIYLINMPKRLDINKDNITSSECNSASTTFFIPEEYVEVVIWRSEEWEKVLYHELVHAFAIDYTLRINKDSENSLKTLLPHYNGSIREAYTEVIATVLNTTRTLSNIKDQCIFSGTQVNKIGYFMESSREELVVLDKNTIANIEDKDGIECIDKFFNNPDRLLDTSANTSSYYIIKSIYLWYGVYKDSDLLDISNIMNKAYINKKFYSVILEALESGEYKNWLKSIYFKPTDISLKMTYY